MQTISKRYIWIFFGVLIAIMAGAYLYNAYRPAPNPKPSVPTTTADEAASGTYYTIRDQNGLTLFQTGLTVHVDDRYINENDIEYIIIKIDEQDAVAKIFKSPEQKPVKSSTDTSWLRIPLPIQSIPVQAAKDSHVVIYHTHTDESFTPTSGTPTKPGKGDVYKLGNTMTDALKKAGISVSHSLEKHDPHDINAYHRSRKTVVQLLKEQPDAAFDIHRDSAPTDAYLTNINGLTTSRTMIVIGRGNPNMQTNLKYAKKVKAKADELYPGLMRGIFMGKGDYNQDLYPTALLFEIGTETLSLDLPQKSTRLLADVLVEVLQSK
ncbi:MAG: stage II sporulation protein P [Bacillota bacterium]|nr:stage II sporulation protein P [Bacillota bacterium]